MRMRLTKMQGCGNDFIFLDSVNSEPPSLLTQEITFLCDRHYGVGADGFVVLRHSDTADVKWDFYNSDGSEAEMCGNAARCAVRYLADRHFPDNDVIAIETKDDIVRGRILEDNLVEITLLSNKVTSVDYEEKVIEINKQVHQVYCINTGVPHAVIQVDDILGYPITDIGSRLVRHPAFGEAGTNVTFFQRLVGNRIMGTTFERGVEKETMACGTGAAAAAIVYSERYLEPLPIEVVVPGGNLIVDISPVSRLLLLQGPAEYVFEVVVEDLVTPFERPRLFEEGRRIH